MRIAIYTRVSTDTQDTQNQLTELLTFAGTQPGWSVTHQFTDTATGGNADREQFNAMFQAAERKEFDTLLFWSMDRLTREGALETLQHLKRLSNAGVGYKSLQESYLDTSNEFNDVVLAIVATKAKAEKRRISERTKAGLARVKAGGVKLGAPVLVSRDVVKAMRKQGSTQAEVSSKLGCSERTIRRIERQEAA